MSIDLESNIASLLLGPFAVTYTKYIAQAGLAAFAPALFAQLAGAATLPVQKRTFCSTTSEDANFDDLVAIPGNELNPIPQPYDGLFFQGFNVAGVIKTDVLPGVEPHSGNNYAASSALSTLTAGTPMFTTNYPDAPDAAFDLKSFYFGCIVNAGAALALPSQCNIEITGYKGQDNSISNAQQVCSQQFQYNPTTSTGPQQMAFTGPISSDCSDLDFVNVQYSLPGGLEIANSDLGVAIDDIVYDLKKECS